LLHENILGSAVACEAIAKSEEDSSCGSTAVVIGDGAGFDGPVDLSRREIGERLRRRVPGLRVLLGCHFAAFIGEWRQ
jgi:hypothetical protein